MRSMREAVRQGIDLTEVAELLLSGEADIGVATVALTEFDERVPQPCCQWTHSVIVPHGHPLVSESAAGVPLRLERLVHLPLISFDAGGPGWPLTWRGR